MKVGIVTITYNMSSLLPVQIEKIRKYCKDDNYDIIVVDNSSINEHANAIVYYTNQYKTRHIRTQASGKYGSLSAVFALDMAYVRTRDDYDYYLFLDHDSFPLRDFSVVAELGDAMMAGVGQQKTKMYFHTGYLMFNNRDIDKHLIDFGCNHEYGLDTGGNLYKVIERYPDKVKFWNEEYCENPYFTEGFYNFYAVINNGMFMHFINGSGWNTLEAARQNERINSLLNILAERTI